MTILEWMTTLELPVGIYIYTHAMWDLVKLSRQ